MSDENQSVVYQSNFTSAGDTSVEETIVVLPYTLYSVTVNVTTGGGFSSNTSLLTRSPETGTYIIIQIELAIEPNINTYGWIQEILV